MNRVAKISWQKKSKRTEFWYWIFLISQFPEWQLWAERVKRFIVQILKCFKWSFPLSELRIGNQSIEKNISMFVWAGLVHQKQATTRLQNIFFNFYITHKMADNIILYYFMHTFFWEESNKKICSLRPKKKTSWRLFSGLFL